jgi:hypothetical protein
MNFSHLFNIANYITGSGNKLAFDDFFIIFDQLNQLYEKMDIFPGSASASGLFTE